jgi:hypothetical protein
VRGHALLTVVLLGASAALVSGCGSGARQDASEPPGTYPVLITHASFPVHQAVSRPARLVLTIRNVGASALPNVAVTLDSFYYASSYPELAANKRPIWVIDRGPGTVPKRVVESEAVTPPGSGQTAYVETWALGKLPPGQTKVFRWLVTPVKPGIQTVHYIVAADLAGKAKARLPSGAIPRGLFSVVIAPKPPARYVNPNTGQVVTGTYPPLP